MPDRTRRGNDRQREAARTPLLDDTFTDLDDNYRLTLRNGVLIHRKRPAETTADATLTLTKGRMLALLAGDMSGPGIDISGDQGVLPVAPRRTGEDRPLLQHRDTLRLAPERREDA